MLKQLSNMPINIMWNLLMCLSIWPWSPAKRFYSYLLGTRLNCDRNHYQIVVDLSAYLCTYCEATLEGYVYAVRRGDGPGVHK